MRPLANYTVQNCYFLVYSFRVIVSCDLLGKLGRTWPRPRELLLHRIICFVRFLVLTLVLSVSVLEFF